MTKNGLMVFEENGSGQVGVGLPWAIGGLGLAKGKREQEENEELHKARWTAEAVGITWGILEAEAMVAKRVNRRYKLKFRKQKLEPYSDEFS